MMLKCDRFQTILCLLLSLCLAACGAVGRAPYRPAAGTYLDLQTAAEDAKVRLDRVIVAESVNTRPLCRLYGPLDPGSGLPVDRYIRDALFEEFLTAEIYDPQAETVIKPILTDMQFSTFPNGRWQLAMIFSSDHHPGFLVEADIRFQSSAGSALVACRRAASAFRVVVDAMIQELALHPEFPTLVNAR